MAAAPKITIKTSAGPVKVTATDPASAPIRVSLLTVFQQITGGATGDPQLATQDW